MDLETGVRALVARFDVAGSPGGVIAVARDGVVETCVPFGYADLEHAVPNARDSVFYIASTSKQFVAASVAVLQADGALSADDPVARWVPEVAALGDLRVHHLVHHTAGIRDKYGLAVVGRLAEESVATDEGTMALLSRQRSLGFPSGSRMSYSNSGYSLLAKVVERCSGQSLVAFTDERVFGPWGMKETRFRADPSELIAHRARGYAPRAGGGYRTAEYGFSALGPGGVVTTVDSLALWAGVFRTDLGEQLQRTRPLEDGSPNPYAYGLVVGEHAGLRMLHHGGAVPGFGAEVLQVPAEGLTVICLANSPAVGAPSLARAALQLVLPAGPRPATVAAAAPRPPAMAVQEVVGSYVDADESVLLTVTEESEGLLLALSGLTVPVTLEDSGWTAAGGVQVEFQVGRVTVSAPDQELAFSRLAPGAPTASEVCGSYTSDELLVTLDVSAGPDGLLLTWPDREPLALRALSADVLTVTVGPPHAAELVVRVLRDGDAVTGLSLGTGRAPRNVFVRA